MSEPKRYFADWSLDADDQVVTHMAEDPQGGFVKWEDYASLKAEVERLTLENDIRQNNMNEMFKEIKEGREAYQRLHNRYMIIVTAKGVQS